MEEIAVKFLENTGLTGLRVGSVVMIGIAFVLFYLGIKKRFEPLLLIPIAFGMFLANLPFAGLMAAGTEDTAGGLLWYFYRGNELGIWPPIIFAGIGAMIDFGPLIADPKSLLLGAAAQFGIFTTFFGAVLLGFNGKDAGSIGIIGGASGPTAIWLTTKLSPRLLGPIGVAAYSYMALVPIIQPPIMKVLTTRKERMVKMEQLRPVSKTEKIVFPVMVTLVVSLIVPPAATLIGMLMLGNLLKEALVVDRLKDTVSNAMMNTVMLLLGLAVGASATAGKFLKIQTIQILILGLFSFAVGTASGVLLAKLMNKLSGGKVNPLIGSAGVSAIPMSARVSQKLGQEANPSNFLLMHAMGPNVAGAIGAAVVAGVMLALFG